MKKIYEICAWCRNGMQGDKSLFYGLCSNCRRSAEGKDYVKKIDSGDDIEESNYISNRYI